MAYYTYTSDSNFFNSEESNVVDVTSLYEAFRYKGDYQVSSSTLNVKPVFEKVHDNLCHLIIPYFNPLDYGFIGGYYSLYAEQPCEEYTFTVIPLVSTDISTVVYHDEWDLDLLDNLILININTYLLKVIKMKKTIEMITIFLLVTLFSGCTFTNTYRVTFVMGGERENITYDVKNQNTITETPDTIYEDYIFLGWYTDSEFNNKFDFTKSITQDTTIYARYSIYELGKENYIAFEDNNKWGFMLPTGETIVEAKYDYVEPFRYGYALVVEDEQFSFIDTLGNEMSQWFDYRAIPYYGTIQFTLDGLAKVYGEENGTIIINTEGNAVFQTTLFIPFDAYYENGLIPAYLYNEDNTRSDICVYLDQLGDIALQNDYHECSSFNDGLAKVKIDSQTVFINTNGEIVLDDNYNTFTIMFDGIKPVYFNEGYAIVKTYASLVEDTNLPRYKIIDQQGNVVLEFGSDIETPVYVTNEYILTKNSDDQVAIYNFSGEKVLDYMYYACNYSGWGIFEDLVVVMNGDGVYGVVDASNGDLSIDFQYDFISGFKDGYAVAEQNGYYGVINQNNQVIVNFEYSQLESSLHIFMNEDI